MAKEKFGKNFKKYLRMGITAACGFLIAYTWRDAVINFSKDLVVDISGVASQNAINVSSSILITVVGVLIIVIAAWLLK
jgi:hypothetical protein